MKRWLRPVLWGGLLLALLWAPTLGLMHRQAHATAHAAHGPHALDALFGHHADNGDCRLFDKCSGGDTLPLLAALVPALPPLAMASVRTGEQALPRWLARFQARGPPPAA